VKVVKIKSSLADMCKALIESGESFKCDAQGVYPGKSRSFDTEMLKYLGKTITIDCNGGAGLRFGEYIVEPYMYDEAEAQYREFEDFFEVPQNAIFREKGGRDYGKILGVYKNGDISFSVINNNNSFKTVLLTKEMTLDNGETWTPAGVLCYDAIIDFVHP